MQHYVDTLRPTPCKQAAIVIQLKAKNVARVRGWYSLGVIEICMHRVLYGRYLIDLMQLYVLKSTPPSFSE